MRHARNGGGGRHRPQHVGHVGDGHQPDITLRQLRAQAVEVQLAAIGDADEAQPDASPASRSICQGTRFA
jgi:hypothetical protein